VSVDTEELKTVAPAEHLPSRRNTFQLIARSPLLAGFGLTCLLAALPLFYIKHSLLADPDIWWHMRTGEWILQNHQIPYSDPFSASTLGRPWVDYCWLFDVGAYSLVARFDLVGIIWFQTLMRVAVTAVLFGLVRSLTPHFWMGVVITGFATLGMAWNLQPRPGAFSVLFFVILLYALVLAKRKSNTRWLWFLPALFVLWANIHVEFVTGLFVLAVCCLAPFLDHLIHTRPEPRGQLDLFQRQLWWVFVACFLATLVNPYGPRLWTTVFQYAADTKIYNVIIEFSAMQFRTINDWAVLALVMMACFALGRIRPFRPVWALLLAWAAWMGFRSLREAWLVAILSAVIITGSRAEEDHASERNLDTGLSMRLAVAATVLVILVGAANVWSLSSQRLFRQVAETFPAGAVSYIHRNHLQGPLLNELSWGGFLIYALPQIPPSMDGRTNVHTQDEILRALQVWNAEPGWENYPELQRANLIISNHEWPLVFRLRNDPRFRIVYEDRTSVLFEAVHAEKADKQPKPQTP